jgi:type II secretory ATPase GspE/PulE/Tfp pilus assembly ATPase PilB-like protein
VLTQRLVRKRAPASSATTYRGRVPIAEFGAMNDDVRKAVVARSDAGILRNLFHQQKEHVTLRQAADRLVQAGITDSQEISRILGD